MSRLVQAANRADAVLRRRKTRLAELVANGLGVNAAGDRLGLTKGEAAVAWRSIKRDLGAQAV